MHEVPLFLHLSLMTITPLSRSRLHVILIFISHFIHISIGVMVPDSLPCFMSYNSCCSHSHIPYKHVIIIQVPHIVTCITYQIKLSSIHSRSHDFVLKHIKLAYNLMTRSNPRARADMEINPRESMERITLMINIKSKENDKRLQCWNLQS